MRAHCDPDCEWNDGSDACCTPSAWEQELMDRSDRYRDLVVELTGALEMARGFLGMAINSPRSAAHVADTALTRARAAIGDMPTDVTALDKEDRNDG